MAYNNKNHLQKIIEVQQVWNLHKEPDVTNRYIYNKYIRKQFHCGTETTFYKWLSIKNPAKLLKQLQDAERKRNNK